MSYLIEAHNEWHLLNGATAICPLDCGQGEDLDEEVYGPPAAFVGSATPASQAKPVDANDPWLTNPPF